MVLPRPPLPCTPLHSTSTLLLPPSSLVPSSSLTVFKNSTTPPRLDNTLKIPRAAAVGGWEQLGGYSRCAGMARGESTRAGVEAAWTRRRLDYSTRGVEGAGRAVQRMGNGQEGVGQQQRQRHVDSTNFDLPPTRTTTSTPLRQIPHTSPSFPGSSSLLSTSTDTLIPSPPWRRQANSSPPPPLGQVRVVAPHQGPQVGRYLPRYLPPCSLQEHPRDRGRYHRPHPRQGDQVPRGRPDPHPVCPLQAPQRCRRSYRPG